jgi:hypothetical protein
MIRTLAFALAVTLVPINAGALEQPADGNWMCGVAGESFAALTISGSDYTATDLADFEHTGTLDISPDGQLYAVRSGALRDIFNVVGFSYDGADHLNVLLVYAGVSPVIGDCRRT